jgi:hypothetical protein
MAAILLALTSSPQSPAGQRALAFAESLAEEGHRLTLCCLQDAVLLASRRAAGPPRESRDRLLERGARCLVLGEDLTRRGLEADPRASVLDHAGVAAALAAGHDRVVGAL